MVVNDAKTTAIGFYLRDESHRTWFDFQCIHIGVVSVRACLRACDFLFCFDFVEIDFMPNIGKSIYYSITTSMFYVKRVVFCVSVRVEVH